VLPLARQEEISMFIPVWLFVAVLATFIAAALAIYRELKNKQSELQDGLHFLRETSESRFLDLASRIEKFEGMEIEGRITVIERSIH
jgi:hypothetical protein